jgi:hypothetical protein
MHVQSCNKRSSKVGRYIHPISSLPVLHSVRTPFILYAVKQTQRDEIHAEGPEAGPDARNFPELRQIVWRRHLAVPPVWTVLPHRIILDHTKKLSIFTDIIFRTS